MPPDPASLKVPPQAIEAEMAVIGSMLIEAEAVEKALERVDSAQFYKDSHRRIFQAVETLYRAGTAIDLVTVGEELRKGGAIGEIGGVTYLSECIHRVSTAAHVEHYADLVHEKAILRDLIHTATKIVQDGYGEKDPAALLDDAQAQILAVAQRQSAAGFQTSKELAHEAISQIEELHKRKNAVTGVATGFPKFDKMTAGLQKGDLILIAARPSQGKTALALNIASNAVLDSDKSLAVAFFSMEMSKGAIMQRLIASVAGANLLGIRSGYFDRSHWTHLTNAASRLAEASLFITDMSNLSVMQVRSFARRLDFDLRQKGKSLGLVMIDYLQLMRGSSRRAENRQQEVSEISRGLKALARDLDIPVVALSQLSRRPEEKGRADSRPQLSDLRESGALEQDADVVAMIYREGYYKRDDPALENKAEIIIAKQRNGPTGDVELRFNRECTRFENLSANSEEPAEEPEESQSTFS